MLKDLNNFQKEGYWLAVVTRNRRLKVAAYATDPKKALQQAHKHGFTEAALMKSAKHYASWIS